MFSPGDNHSTTKMKLKGLVLGFEFLVLGWGRGAVIKCECECELLARGS